MLPLDENNTKLNEDISLNHPYFYYEGGIPEDHDIMDYYTFTLKGVRIP